MNSLQGSSGDVGQNNLKDEKLIGNLKKRRPLSAVFIGASSSLRNGVDKKRNSIFNLRGSDPTPPIAVVRPSSSRQSGSLKESVGKGSEKVGL